MESDNRAELNHAEQVCNVKEDGREKHDAFISSMVQLVEKYGKFILQDLDYVA